MNKLFSITISAVLLTSLAATILVSCKKDTQEIEQRNSLISGKTEAQRVYEKIIKFHEACEAYHTKAKTDNGYVSPSEARSILDAAINYEFSYVNRHLEDTQLDTLRYSAPQTNSEGNIAINDLIDIYDSFALSIENDKNSVNHFMINYPLNNIRNEDVEIIFTRGVPVNPEPIPYLDYFVEDDNWIWGMDNGKCDGSIRFSDAAQELTKKCNAMLSNNTRDDIDTASHNIFTFDIDYEIKTYDSLQSIVNGVDYWLFHAENVMHDDVSYYCITYDYLNLFLRNLYHTIINHHGCYHYSTRYNSPIRRILIVGETPTNDFPNNTYYNISHQAALLFYKTGLPN